MKYSDYINWKTNKPRVVFIVKYFYPTKRISGILSFLYVLCDFLSKDLDIVVISAKTSKDEKRLYNHNGYKIIKINKLLYPIESALLTKKINPDLIFYFSGIARPILASFYFGLSRFILGKNKKILYCQCTHFFKKPNIITSWFFNSFDELIGTHPNIVKALQEVTNKPVSFIPPAIDANKLNEVKCKKVRNTYIGFFGHFHKGKGVDLLIKTFLKLPYENVKLILGGKDNKFLKSLKPLLNKNNRIKIYNYMDDIYSLINLCDFIVLPYRTSAYVLGISQTLLEAMYLGKPVIGSKTPCLDIIKSEYNGLIFRNENDLLSKMITLIQDHELLNMLSINAHKTISENYTISLIGKKFLKLIYKKVTKNG